jgi:hypothetical protein
MRFTSECGFVGSHMRYELWRLSIFAARNLVLTQDRSHWRPHTRIDFARGADYLKNIAITLGGAAS